MVDYYAARERLRGGLGNLSDYYYNYANSTPAAVASDAPPERPQRQRRLPPTMTYPELAAQQQATGQPPISNLNYMARRYAINPAMSAVAGMRDTGVENSKTMLRGIGSGIDAVAGFADDLGAPVDPRTGEYIGMRRPDALRPLEDMQAANAMARMQGGVQRDPRMDMSPPGPQGELAAMDSNAGAPPAMAQQQLSPGGFRGAPSSQMRAQQPPMELNAPPIPAPQPEGGPPGMPQDMMPRGQIPERSAARNYINDLLGKKDSQAPWLALAAAGFGAAGSGSPYPMQALGQGGMQGVKTLTDLQERDAQNRMRAATLGVGMERDDEARRHAGVMEGQGQQRINQGQKEIDLASQRLFQSADQFKQTNALADRKQLSDEQRNKSYSGYYDALADYTKTMKGKTGDAKLLSQNINDAYSEARKFADSAHPKDITGNRPTGWQKAYNDKLGEIWRIKKLPGAVGALPEVPPMPGAQRSPLDGKWYVGRRPVIADDDSDDDE